MRHEVIFQIHSPQQGWLDYCRETSPFTDLNPTNNWAKDKCRELEADHRLPFRFVVEQWR